MVAKSLPDSDPIHKISIIPRGQALGVTLSTPDTDKYGYDEEYLRGRIVGALGGMAAEDAVFGVVTTGAESDLRQATGIARQMVGRWGMSEKVGPVYVLSDQIDPRTEGIAENTLDMVDEEVRRIIGECQTQAVQLLKEHRAQLEAIATALLEHETLDENQVYAAAGIERPKSDITMTKINAKPDQPTGLNGGPVAVPDAPWAPPDPGQLIGA
jgi:cell division protease FtsH